MAKNKTFKTVEKDAINSPVKDIEWEGEEIGVESDTKLESDTGTGQEIILRFFDFAANPEVFRQHKPTEQELFNSHKKGMEAMLWTDGLTPYEAIEPRLLFSKDKTAYRFVISCIPSAGNTLLEKTNTLSELLTHA
jgi:hypothetical protein